jgi:hypothetical protein
MAQAKGSKRRAPATTTPTAAPTPVPSPAPAEDETQEWVNRRASAQATRAANARQVSGRRRFVDPTTCERDYSAAEREFMDAMHQYKQRSGRMFPTWSEVLEVLKSLGYAKPCPPPGAATGVSDPALSGTKPAQTA